MCTEQFQTKYSLAKVIAPNGVATKAPPITTMTLLAITFFVFKSTLQIALMLKAMLTK